MTELVGKLNTLFTRADTYERGDDLVAQCYSDAHLINKPFFFQGTNGRAVLLLHGWTSTPYEMRALGSVLHRAGYSVYAPLLSGHGTRPEDLEGMRWTRWLSDAEDAFTGLAQEYKEIHVGGMSAGGSLALHIAQRHSNVASLLLMGTPYKLRHERIGRTMACIMKRFVKYKKKRYPRILGVRPSMTQLISYQRYPLESAFQAYKAIMLSTRNLHRVSQPCMMIQSHHDHLVARNSIHRLHAAIASQHKEMYILRGVSHNFMGDIEQLDIADDILKFLDTRT